jgi:hypothetical protein
VEIQDQKYIIILNTIETIQRINKSIAFHQTAPDPNKLAIEQWVEIKADLLRQLEELFAEIDVPMRAVA